MSPEIALKSLDSLSVVLTTKVCPCLRAVVTWVRRETLGAKAQHTVVLGASWNGSGLMGAATFKSARPWATKALT